MQVENWCRSDQVQKYFLTVAADLQRLRRVLLQRSCERGATHADGKNLVGLLCHNEHFGGHDGLDAAVGRAVLCRRIGHLLRRRCAGLQDVPNATGDARRTDVLAVDDPAPILHARGVDVVRAPPGLEGHAAPAQLWLAKHTPVVAGDAFSVGAGGGHLLYDDTISRWAAKGVLRLEHRLALSRCGHWRGSLFENSARRLAASLQNDVNDTLTRLDGRSWRSCVILSCGRCCGGRCAIGSSTAPFHCLAWLRRFVWAQQHVDVVGQVHFAFDAGPRHHASLRRNRRDRHRAERGCAAVTAGRHDADARRDHEDAFVEMAQHGFHVAVGILRQEDEAGCWMLANVQGAASHRKLVHTYNDFALHVVDGMNFQWGELYEPAGRLVLRDERDHYFVVGRDNNRRNPDHLHVGGRRLGADVIGKPLVSDATCGSSVDD